MKDFKTQLAMLVGMIIRPRQTILALPSGEAFLVAGIINAWFTYARVKRQGTMPALAEPGTLAATLGGILVVFILSIIAWWISSIILRAIVGLFGKKLTTQKVMNLIGYAQAPRLLVSVPANLAVLFFPAASSGALLGAMGGQSTPMWLVLFAIVGAVLVFYSLGLLIWGLVISPSQ